MTIFDVTGWHSVNSARSLGFGEIRIYNLIRIAGYIPVIGIMTGCLNLTNKVIQIHKIPAARNYEVIRGSVEILGLGILFLLPDILVSASRFCHAPY